MTGDRAVPLATIISALRHSHDRLTHLTAPLTGQELTAPSYDDDWTIAQVLSHLGSGAQIFGLFLDAGLRGAAAPGTEQLTPVWDRWNAMDPQRQAREAVTADTHFLDRLDELSEEQRRQWRLSLFGGEQQLPDLLRHRLAEHAVHTWDVAVALDPAATVAPEAVELLVDDLAPVVARSGKPAEPAARVHVTTRDPRREYLLEIGPDGPRLSTVVGRPTGADASLDLPAEALIRLVHGRLDPAHTPPTDSDDVDLGTLREVFPGF